jgi:UDP-4-amino-4-deoxy-L-arabinose formyltransferase/UDP-glucuronic acid dehydrogenase (UDP-4-keto-hexauronic acid decarboxylating)
MLFSFYYRNMLKAEILSIPSKGALNLHGSLLPAYRGRCPVNWVLVNGEKETGVTLHHMTEKPDDGDMVGQEKILISDEDTGRSLHKKSTEAVAVLLNKALPLLKQGKAPRIPQDNSKSSYFNGRGPKDGEIIWGKTATEVRNLVRAVTSPYPGAFSFTGNRKVFIWNASVVPLSNQIQPGTVINTSPFVIACGKDAVKVLAGQSESGLYVTGEQLANELRLVEGMRFGQALQVEVESNRKKHVLILGVNGFIGNSLSERLIDSGKYEVHGMDIHNHGIERLMGKPGFQFHEGDISIHREWVEYHVKKCDIILPLVAIATPAEYTRNPLRVFELDFEEIGRAHV